MMIAPLLTALLLLAQPAPAQAAPVEKPAAPPAPPSARLDAALNGLKGKPTAAFTSKLGPADTIKQATDGQVLFWTINLPGETVCGGADGDLTCRRQGGGDCVVAAAFKADGLMSAFRSTGVPAACDKVADQLNSAG